MNLSSNRLPISGRGLRISIALAVVLSFAAAPAGAETYAIDPARSQVVIQVGKAGFLSFVAGHTHQVAGPAAGRIDREEDVARSHVGLVIDSAALKVLPDDEPPGDVPKVQAAMESEVLETARYPTITFESTSIAVESRHDNVLDLRVIGRLTIRGITHLVTVPVDIELQQAALTATGRFSIKQTDYGITPISVSGVVKVKDELDLRFTIVASVNH